MNNRNCYYALSTLLTFVQTVNGRDAVRLLLRKRGWLVLVPRLSHRLHPMTGNTSRPSERRKGEDTVNGH